MHDSMKHYESFIKNMQSFIYDSPKKQLNISGDFCNIKYDTSLCMPSPFTESSQCVSFY